MLRLCDVVGEVRATDVSEYPTQSLQVLVGTQKYFYNDFTGLASNDLLQEPLFSNDDDDAFGDFDKKGSGSDWGDDFFDDE